MRILHVEDDEDTRTLVALVLQGEGWEVVSVDNAQAGLNHARETEFDLFLIDNWIRGDDGNELCHGLRAIDPHIPILFYSGAAYPLDVEKAAASGAQGYLAKPTTPEVLVEEILKLTRKRREFLRTRQEH